MGINLLPPVRQFSKIFKHFSLTITRPIQNKNKMALGIHKIASGTFTRTIDEDIFSMLKKL
jgi:hypothetical protein